MRFSSVLFSLAATGALCSPTGSAAGLTEDCADLEVLGRAQGKITESTDASTLSALRSCQLHPSELGIVSAQYDPNESANLTSPAKRGDFTNEVAGLEKRGTCAKGGRGHGYDYDYGCTDGFCWRNCNGPFLDADAGRLKEWCWLKYEGGERTWTPCGRWQDCEYSYNSKNAKCAKGNCKSCGCGC